MSEDPLRDGLNYYTYCANNPIFFIDPSGCLAVEQILGFLWEFGVEGWNLTKSTTGGGLWSTITNFVGTGKIFIQTFQDLASGNITLTDVISSVGQDAWDGLTGDMRYLFENYHLFSLDVKLTDAQVKELAKHTAGAYQEAVAIGATVYGLTKAGRAAVNTKAGSLNSQNIKPPGWNDKWEWRYPETNKSHVQPRWFDPAGGEWRWHSPDTWHSQGHWDYNPWDAWNSGWQNIYPE